MRSIFRPLWPAVLVAASVLLSSAGETPPVAAASIRHTSTLKFLKGTYTSIFGIVPKKYALESVETRESVQSMRGPDEFTLELVAANTQRILSLEGETPTVESGSKPLVGKTIRAVRRGEAWEPEIAGLASPSAEEGREARRLVARFQPDGSPFRSPQWDESGKATLELSRVLRFFGYVQADEVQGTATLRKPESEGAEAKLDFSVHFVSGESTDRLTVELKGAGGVQLQSEVPGYSKVRIEGELTIHGQRVLEDGRKVPYSLITPYSYETAAEAKAAQ